MKTITPKEAVAAIKKASIITVYRERALCTIINKPNDTDFFLVINCEADSFLCIFKHDFLRSQNKKIPVKGSEITLINTNGKPVKLTLHQLMKI